MYSQETNLNKDKRLKVLLTLTKTIKQKVDAL